MWPFSKTVANPTEALDALTSQVPWPVFLKLLLKFHLNSGPDEGWKADVISLPTQEGGLKKKSKSLITISLSKIQNKKGNTILGKVMASNTFLQKRL